jgi:hypothetical protein
LPVASLMRSNSIDHGAGECMGIIVLVPAVWPEKAAPAEAAVL